MKFPVIEDEEGLRKSIVQYLTVEGNICDWASTYEQGYQKLSIYDYDCILLDLTLPDGEGLLLLKYLKKINKTDGVSDFYAEGIRLASPHGVFGWQHLNMLELRYGHYSRSTGLLYSIISLNLKVK